MMPLISAYVPCFNNAATIRNAVNSLLAQTLRPAEVVVVDDGSIDGSVERLRALDVRIIRHDRNLGRGAVRARAMHEAVHDLVLCCDATNVLEPSFAENALPWFENERVAAVVGRITQVSAPNVIDRWRGRHLFKVDVSQTIEHNGLLSTWGALVRASSARAVGGFDPELRHSEDRDLGGRLRAAQFDVVHDPRLRVICITSNTLGEVLERYWRWYAGTDESTSWHDYWRAIGYSLKGMVVADLGAADPLSVPISLFVPHFQFWRSRLRRVFTDRAATKNGPRSLGDS
jgi:glycosyltransferase involved in cell wall biosynthesis